MTEKAENQTSGKAEVLELPKDSNPIEVKAEENAQKKEAEAEKVAGIVDISAEVNSEIKKAISIEKKQKLLDEKNLNFFTEEINEEETKKSLIPLILFTGIFVTVGIFIIKNKRNRVSPALDEELDKSSEQKINSFGMVE